LKKPTKVPLQNVILPKAIARTKGKRLNHYYRNLNHNYRNLNNNAIGAKEKYGTTPILEYIKDGDPVGLEEHLANFPNSIV
jgi:hypothetical protein